MSGLPLGTEHACCEKTPAFSDDLSFQCVISFMLGLLLLRNLSVRQLCLLESCAVRQQGLGLISLGSCP